MLRENILIYRDIKQNFDNEKFKKSIYTFQNALLYKLSDLHYENNVDYENRTKIVIKCGKELRNFVKKYTNIDTSNPF